MYVRVYDWNPYGATSSSYVMMWFDCTALDGQQR